MNASGWLEKICAKYAGETALEDACTGERVHFQNLPDRCLQVFASANGARPNACKSRLLTPDTTLQSALELLGVLLAGQTLVAASNRLPAAGLDFFRSIADGHNALPGTIFFTSGSSAKPKAVFHAFSSHVANAEGAAAILPIQPGDRWWINLPLYHVSGFGALIRTLHGGGTAVLAAGKPNALSAAACRSCTHRSLVSTQLRRALAAQDFPQDHWKALLCGGGPFPAELLNSAISRGLPLHLTYGMTECASQITTSQRLQTAPGPFACGHPLPFREVKVDSEGQILVRGKVLFAGYVVPGMPLEPSVDSDGWFATSDLGVLHLTGGLVVLGRRDRRFVAGGENVSPERIEAALENLPGVRRAFVLPVADAEFGFRPAVFLSANAPCEEIEERLREQLTGLEIPVRWLQWPQNLPPDSPKLSLAFFKGLLAEEANGSYILPKFE